MKASRGRRRVVPGERGTGKRWGGCERELLLLLEQMKPALCICSSGASPKRRLGCGFIGIVGVVVGMHSKDWKAPPNAARSGLDSSFILFLTWTAEIGSWDGSQPCPWIRGNAVGGWDLWERGVESHGHHIYIPTRFRCGPHYLPPKPNCERYSLLLLDGFWLSVPIGGTYRAAS